MLWPSSDQFCSVSRIDAKNPIDVSVGRTREGRGTSAGPGRYTSWAGKSGWVGARLIPKVGRPGHSESKKWMGKLLLIPPSENQQRTASRVSGERLRSRT